MACVHFFNTGKLLLKAARMGNSQEVCKLIEGGACVDTKDKTGQTALMIVAQNWRYAPLIAISLISGGADVNIQDKTGKTALMYCACVNEDTALAIIEHSKDLDLNTVDNQGQTALMKAAISGMKKIALALIIERGADINIRDEEGKTALMHAIAWPNEGDTALAIIEHSKDLDLNTVDNQGQTALMKAAISGMTKIALALIKRGADVNIKDEEGKTALTYAMEKRKDVIVEIIRVIQDSSVNSVDDQGQTPLMKAAIYGMTTIALALIKRGADINGKDKEGKTPLMYSILYGEDETAIALTNEIKHSNVNSVDNQGQNALMKAAIRGMTKVVLSLIERGADVNIRDKKGKTALMHAIQKRYEDTALAIIEHSKNLVIDIVDNHEQTALIYAAIQGMIKVVLPLLQRGADVNIKDKKGKTALMHAIQKRYEDTALAIIEHSKNLVIDIVDIQGQTALISAAIQGMIKVVLPLLQRGADVNIRDKKGKTALMHAIQKRYEDIALAIIEHSKNLDIDTVDDYDDSSLIYAAVSRMTKVVIELIKRGADVNIRNKMGKTALMYAIYIGIVQTALAIIEHSKNLVIDIVDNHEQTALIYAAIRGMTKVVLSLIERGADVNIKDKEGETALMHAIQKSYEDTALAIIEHSKNLDIDTVDNYDDTSLIYAAISGMTKVVIELIKRGADVNIRNKMGKTALISVCAMIFDPTVAMYGITDKYEVTALAIIEHSKDLDLNAVDNHGRTALMESVLNKMNKTALKLIKNGADVNMDDKQGKTALMSIGLPGSNVIFDSDAGELTLALIDAGVDVNKADDKGNTALIYNVKYEACVKALIEEGKALVDLRNYLGRSALFYALVESISSARYLVENGANLHFIDNYNVCVVSYFFHHCINNRMRSVDIMHERLGFLNDNGIKVKSLLDTITNAVFCKLPLAIISHNYNFNIYTAISSLLNYAGQLSKKSFSIRKDSKYRSFDELAAMLRRASNIKIADLYTAVDKLLDLGADPNSSDEQGNTIAHYITLLELNDYATGGTDILNVLLFLEEKGLSINQKNCNNKSPLFFLLSNAIAYRDIGRKLNIKSIVNMCVHLIGRNPNLAQDTLQSGESVYHFMIKLFNVGDNEDKQRVLELLKMLTNCIVKSEVLVNRGDYEMNTPLHIWAALSPTLKEGKGKQTCSDKISWQEVLGKILHHLLDCGSIPDSRNLKGETALHKCRTWTAIKLLVKEGAKTTVVDSTGRSPLLTAAQKSLFLENPGCFFPDVPSRELPTFWRTVMDMGFDLWKCDNNGDSIISNLIKENSLELADALIEMVCDNSKSLSDETLVGLLNAICENDSTQKNWKSILVDKLLKSIRRSLDMSGPLRSCCLNIIAHVCSTKGGKDTTEFDSVHYQIAKQLLRYGAPGKSCLDIAKKCPPLHDFLSTPIPIEEKPMVIPWTCYSQNHKKQLSEVARGQNYKVQGPYWYHKTQIGRGAFGQVFVGIHEKDSMEVAIKRVQYTQQDREEDIREIRNFAYIPVFKHVVRYLAFIQTPDYSFIIMELMEGNLIEYFASSLYDRRKTKVLCRDIALGLKYLHEQNIIHRDLKPTNILYKTDPQLCLKIADFGLSRRIDVNASFTVMTTGGGTPGWIAPEVIKSTAHSMSSDVFSLGLILHYISSNQRHPFSPADCTGKSDQEINIATQSNILKNDMEGWSKSLDPESSHRIKGMLNCINEKDRPTAQMLLDHPMFWSKKKKLDFLSAVGNQEEFECPRAKRIVPLTKVEQDLENKFKTIVKFAKWDDSHYTQTSVIFIEMQKPIVKHDKKGKPYTVSARKYDSGSAVELVRFIRNAIAHVSEASRPPAIRTQILEDAVFLDEFPTLVIEVFKAVTAHGWDVSREEIKHVLAND